MRLKMTFYLQDMDLDEGPDGMEEEIFETEEKKTVSTRSRTRSRSRSRLVFYLFVEKLSFPLILFIYSWLIEYIKTVKSLDTPS